MYSSAAENAITSITAKKKRRKEKAMEHHVTIHWNHENEGNEFNITHTDTTDANILVFASGLAMIFGAIKKETFKPQRKLFESILMDFTTNKVKRESAIYGVYTVIAKLDEETEDACDVIENLPENVKNKLRELLKDEDEA